ncbi:hypothetical protein GALMADRAFT_1174973 [Galerina marginata CBS 339.88]|uniref:F-box domain-containing protein n=1 Tax=Galerina marginata (strain CBS 339.88) TaxID=685588 RepID=A0A067TJE2_GALM3|nr:hypothetical protein GALMADRAFT_1174973 [Galerina marginata CBS 339.88]
MGLLPPELLRLLMEDLKSERSTLHALTLTSRAMRCEATRLLYASMTDSSGTAHFKFLSTIQRVPAELAPLVRVYHLPTLLHKGTRGQKGIWHLILQCLPLMINLKELAFHRIIGSPSNILPPLGKDCPAPFQLHRFTWNWNSAIHLRGRTYDEQALSFLETQHELTSLQWSSSNYVASTFPTNACRKLKYIEGNINAVMMFLPSRSVTELRWLNPWHHYSNSFEDIQGLVELEALHSFSIESYSYLRIVTLFSKNNARSVALSRLEALEFCLGHLDDRNPTDLVRVVSSFPRLRKLVITNIDKSSPHQIWAPDGFNPQIRQLFEKCTQLRYVDISWDADRIYRRWVDGSPLPELLVIERERILELE